MVIYYSYTGNTKKVAEILCEYLRQKGDCELIELNPLDESKNFFIQANRALRKTRAKLSPVDFNLAQFDFICFGTPVWAFAPAPAINTYLDRCTGLESKRVIIFITYGSGAGTQGCLRYMEKTLRKKGAKEVLQFGIQRRKVKDRKFILSEINKLRLWPNG